MFLSLHLRHLSEFSHIYSLKQFIVVFCTLHNDSNFEYLQNVNSYIFYFSRQLTAFHQCTRNITRTCGDSQFSLQLVHKSWWALELYCPNIECSITRCKKCITNLYNSAVIDNSNGSLTCKRDDVTNDNLKALCSNSTCE